MFIAIWNPREQQIVWRSDYFLKRVNFKSKMKPNENIDARTRLV